MIGEKGKILEYKIPFCSISAVSITASKKVVLFLVLFSGTEIPVVMYLVKADLTELTSLSFLKCCLYCPPRTAPARDLFLWLLTLSFLFWFLLASLSHKC